MTQIEIPESKKEIVHKAGMTLKGVWDVGFRKIFVDNQTSLEKKYQELLQISERQGRAITKLQIFIFELQEQQKKEAKK